MDSPGFSLPCPGEHRLDLCLAQAYPRWSRQEWKDLIRLQGVSVDGRKVFRPGTSLVRGMIIAGPWPRGPATLSDQWTGSPEPMTVADLDGLLLVNKPPGIPSHPLDPSETATLANWLASRHPGFAAAGPKGLEGGLINRLDNGTSGLVLVARDRAAWERWAPVLGRDSVDGPDKGFPKVYVAAARGRAPGPSWETSWPLAHAARSSRRMVAVGSDSEEAWRGSPRMALTRWVLVEQQAGAFLALALIRKGQFHQIRCHAAALGTPLLGDPIYHKELDPEGSPASGVHSLHAWGVKIGGTWYHAPWWEGSFPGSWAVVRDGMPGQPPDQEALKSLFIRSMLADAD